MLPLLGSAPEVSPTTVLFIQAAPLTQAEPTPRSMPELAERCVDASGDGVDLRSDVVYTCVATPPGGPLKVRVRPRSGAGYPVGTRGVETCR